jgi:hypothetical protein
MAAGRSALGLAAIRSPGATRGRLWRSVRQRRCHRVEVILPAWSAPQAFEDSEKAVQALRDALASGEELISDRVQIRGHNEYVRAVALPQLAGIGSF